MVVLHPMRYTRCARYDSGVVTLLRLCEPRFQRFGAYFDIATLTFFSNFFSSSDYLSTKFGIYNCPMVGKQILTQV